MVQDPAWQPRAQVQLINHKLKELMLTNLCWRRRYRPLPLSEIELKERALEDEECLTQAMVPPVKLVTKGSRKPM
jgi:hypothetical protein